MALRVWGDVFDTSDLTDTSMPLRFKPTKNIVLRAVRTWYVFSDDPTFTNLNMKLYADRGGDVAGLIATSTNTQAKGDIFTDNSAYAEIHFQFSDIALRKDTFYNLVTNGTGYTASGNSVIAWAKAFPDPIYPDPKTPAFEGMHVAPYFLTVIGDDL